MLKSILLVSSFLLTSLLVTAQPELWGTVSNGGNYGHGYIFKTDSVGDNLQIVHHFDSINGKDPGALLAASDNKIYGVTSAGGVNNQGLFSGGVLYVYDLNTSSFTALQHFGQNNTDITGVRPAGSGMRTLTEVSPGIIYGQLKGAYQGGVIFAFNAATQTISTALTLPTYQGGTYNSTLGNLLSGALYKASDGFLYGTTYTNSQCPIPNPNLGSIIRIDPATYAFSIRYLTPCNGNNGFHYESNFATYNNKLYSVTKAGGANSKGVIYSFEPATNTYSNKYNFLGGVSGWQPSAMIQAANGKFYGLADGGTPEPYHPDGCGILFEFDPVTDQFTKKLDFTYGNGYIMNVGAFPFSMINGHNEKLYGATTNGIFEYNVATNQTIAKSRFPINMGWYSPGNPSLTLVCKKPVYAANLVTQVSACKGDNILIDLQSDNTEQVVWRQNGSIDGGQTGITLELDNVTTTAAGTWQAELSNSCGTTLVPAITIVVSGNIQVAETAISLEVTNGGDSFQWIDCQTQLPLQNMTAAIFTPQHSGSYAVEVSTGNCTDTSACYTIDLDPLSTEEISSEQSFVFPNPVHSFLHISSSLSFDQVIIHDVSGKIILSEIYGSSIDVSSLQKGIYLISVYSSDYLKHTNRFVKE